MKTKNLFYLFILTLTIGSFSSCNQQAQEQSTTQVAVVPNAETYPNALKIVATVTLKDAAFQADFEKALKAVVDGTNTEEGNISYEAQKDINNPLVYVIIEVWKSQEAIDFHNETPHFKAFVVALGDNADLAVNIMKKFY